MTEPARTQLTAEQREALSKRFRVYGERECRGSSPLYEYLSYWISEDDQLLELASHARPGQPTPNLLFAAVHFLLLGGSGPDLGRYYASIASDPLPAEESGHPFREFCRSHRQEVIGLLESGLVQTNAVRRCAYLYPAFLRIHELGGSRPLHLIEAGTSAGLNLLWDQYAYDYGDGEIHGRPGSEVLLRSEFRNDRRPDLGRPLPEVNARIGIDLRVLDTSDETSYRWLLALIWPEHHDRRQLIEQARRVALCVPPRFIEGNAVDLLPDLLAAVPASETVCVYHTHVANQMNYEEREKLVSLLQKAGTGREVFHLFNNMPPDMDLRLVRFRGGQATEWKVAKVDGHARWIDWLFEPCETTVAG